MLSGTTLWFDTIVCVGRLINGEVGRDDHALHVLCSRETKLAIEVWTFYDGQFVYLQYFCSHWLDISYFKSSTKDLQVHYYMDEDTFGMF